MCKILYNYHSNNKDIIGYRGAVAFKEAGEQTITLQYKSGNHKLNVIGVDLVKGGAVVTSDYHYGTTGGSHSNNVYTIDVPEKGAYLVRIFVDQTESIASEGSILYSGKVKPAEVKFGADPNKGQAAAPAARVLAEGTEINDGTSLSDTWVAADWQAVAAENVPAGVTALEIPNTGVRSLNNSVSIKTAGRITVGLQYQSGSRGIYTAGVDVVDASGNVVAGEYRKDFTGGSKNIVTYSFIVPQAGNYTLRYLEDVSFEATDCSGKLTLSYAAVDVASLEAGVDATDNWSQAEWTEVSTAPAGLTALGYNASQLRNITSVLNISSGGTLRVDYHYNDGSMKLCIAGADLLDCTGRVVDSDYHNGAAGSSHVDNVYTLEVPAAGTYVLRYWCQTKDEGLSNSNGTITLSLTARTGIRLSEDETITDAWDPDKWEVAAESEIPARVNEVGAYYPDVKVIQQELVVPVDGGTLSAEFLYSSGSHRLDIVGVDVLDANGDVIASDYHFGFTGGEKSDNVYTMTIPYAGTFTLRYLCTTKTNETNQTGNINLKYGVAYTLYLEPAATTPIYGDWSRNTTLQAGKTWNVSAVVGLMAEGQARRSFLAYSERERAVPWRAFPAYISWYELNINRNNNQDYTGNMTVEQCEEVVSQWKENLFDKHNTRVKSFVWDDGWDSYGTWTFNKNFPNGFSEPDAVVKEMGSNIGAWLGPVGGYGESGNYRRSYWSDKGGMQLSNPAYYDVFLTACTNMINDYSFNFFKFDGISGQFSAVGPDAGTTGEENAEAIINIEREVRKIKPDIFLNTTVGTWASPFWFRFTDAVWRQENDYDVTGDNTIKRENWITYRDRLVYQNFVQNSPLCPINTLMTHGFILTNYGPPANPENDSYDAILRELRCAFACGSGMVELYNDFSLTNEINNGALWADIAECIRWQEKNADVLPDIHWVGGNPWTGGKAEVYGWASWNGKKATLALRNGANEAQNYTFTLREALDIPAYVNTTITLSQAFEVQNALPGLDLNKSYDIDEEITVTLPGSSVFVFDGIDNVGSQTTEHGYNLQVSEAGVATLHLPYPTEIPAGVEVKYITAETAEPTMVEQGVYTLRYTPLNDIVLPANTPVVVVAEPGSYLFLRAMEVGTPVTGNLLVGSTDGKKPSAAKMLYALGKQDGAVAFYPYAANGYDVNKAYLDISSLNLDAAEVKKIIFAGDGLADGIGGVEASAEGGAYTDLSGRRVAKPVKGIYIQQGKKKVINN